MRDLGFIGVFMDHAESSMESLLGGASWSSVAGYPSCRLMLERACVRDRTHTWASRASVRCAFRIGIGNLLRGFP